MGKTKERELTPAWLRGAWKPWGRQPGQVLPHGMVGVDGVRWAVVTDNVAIIAVRTTDKTLPHFDAAKAQRVADWLASDPKQPVALDLPRFKKWIGRGTTARRCAVVHGVFIDRARIVRALRHFSDPSNVQIAADPVIAPEGLRAIEITGKSWRVAVMGMSGESNPHDPIWE